MLRALYVLDAGNYERIYGPDERAAIASLVELYAPPQTRASVAEHPEVLAEADVILSGWGAPVLDEAFLAAAPRLKAFFYGAGSVKGLVTEATWKRGIVVTSAWAANAVPVAEYTVAQIFLCLKRVWQIASQVRREGAYPLHHDIHLPGAYRSIVGLVSLGMVGRKVCELLRQSDLELIAYDPFITNEQAAMLGVERVSLEELFRRADVVSLHTPWLKETEGLIGGALLASMKPGATFINTARGAVVREDEMIRVLVERPDLFAVLDVTWPEPPEAGSPLYTLPNVFLTPHIAGSMDAECHRMARYMVEELRRYLAGEPLKWQIMREAAPTLA